MSTFLVIGGSSGIGQSLVGHLLSEGHQVVATYRQQEPVVSSDNVSYFSVDITAESPDFSFIPEVLDGVAFCPGAIQLRSFERIKPADFLQDFQLQVVGAIKAVQAALPSLKRSGNASVVLFSTVAVQTGLPFHTQVSASKGALEGLVRALAAEYAPSVRFNAIAPSLTDTPLAAGLLSNEQKREANALRHPMKRVGQPSDIAAMAAFLLSGKNNWITGQIIHVDGGMSSLKIG